jgi:hypothetical protein
MFFNILVPIYTLWRCETVKEEQFQQIILVNSFLHLEGSASMKFYICCSSGGTTATYVRTHALQYRNDITICAASNCASSWKCVSLHNINQSRQRQRFHYHLLSHKNIHIQMNYICCVKCGLVTSLWLHCTFEYTHKIILSRYGVFAHSIALFILVLYTSITIWITKISFKLIILAK